jgi:hypothetical protein
MSHSSKRSADDADLADPSSFKRPGIITDGQGPSPSGPIDGRINVPQPPRRAHAPPAALNHSVETFGLLTEMSRTRTGPAPMHDDVYIIVDSANYTGYFTSLYETVIRLVYPDFDPAAAVGVITEDNFIRVCRYLMKARCDHVFGKVSGRRPPRRIPIPSEMLVPNALAQVINGIGVVVVDSGAYPVIPQPEAINAVDANQNLDVVVTHAILRQFVNLVTAASNRGLIRTGTVSTITQGTAYWILTARDTANPDVVAPQDANHCTIYSVVKDWTPADAMLAAICLNQYPGQFASMTEMKWTCEPFRAIGGIRASFNADA